MQEELIREFQNGNKRAGDDFYNANINLVYSITRKYTKLYIGQEEVKAIVNQAFAHAMKNVDLNKAKFSTYFTVVANGMISRHCRDYAHMIRTSRSDYAATGKSVFCDSLDRVTNYTDSEYEKLYLMDTLETEDDCTGVLVNEALNHLNLKDRQAFKLKVIGGLTQAKIARILGVSQVQISRSITRSKKQLKIILKEVC